MPQGHRRKWKPRNRRNRILQEGARRWPSCFLFDRQAVPVEEKGCREVLVIFRKRVAGLSGTQLSRFVAQAKRVVGLKGDVHVLVTSSREVRRLNRRFRAKDTTTDVLSFPATARLPDGLAGDVAISAEIAMKNARRLGHSTAEEVKILALHGVLHLAGYDHERDQGEMARKEQRLRKSLGLPEGLIERSQPRRSRGAGDGISAKGIRTAPGTGKRSGAAETIQ